MSAAIRLSVTKDGATIRTLELADQLSLGRSADAGLRLEDRAISREHALFRRVGDSVQVEKRSEFGPLLINGEDRTSALLRDSDVVAVGPYLIRVSREPLPAAGLRTELAPSRGAPSGEAPSGETLALAGGEGVGLQAVSDAASPLEFGADGSADPYPQSVAAPELPELNDVVHESSPESGFEPGIDAGLDIGIDAGVAAPTSESEFSAPALITPADEPARELPDELDPAAMERGYEREPTVSLSAADLSLLGVPIEGAQVAGSAIEAAPPSAPQDSDSLSPEAATPELGYVAEISAPHVSGGDGATQLLDPEAAPLQAHLEFAPASASRERLELASDRRWTLGRGKECDVVLNDKRSSRKHAEIYRAGKTYRIRDLDSANGTFVNGVRVEGERELFGDDRVQLGDSEFVYRAVSDRYAADAGSAAGVPSLQWPGDGGEIPVGEGSAQSAPIEFDGAGVVGGAASGDPFAIDAPVEAPAIDSGLTPPPFKTHAGATPPDFVGVPGLDPQAAGTKSGRVSLMQKYRELPTVRRWIVTFCLIAIFYFVFYDEEPAPPAPKPATQPRAAKPASITDVGQLSAEQRRFVESQQAVAFEHFRNREFDQALLEVRKIFPVFANYEPAKELERYALDGKRKKEAEDEERRKQEEEARTRTRVAQWINDARVLMRNRKYAEANEIFYQVLGVDPDNAQVADWKREIAAWEEEQRLLEQQRSVQREINRRAEDILLEAMRLRTQGACPQAIATLLKITEMGANDPGLSRRMNELKSGCLARIRAVRDPLLAEGRAREAQGSYADAYRSYQRADQVDPTHPDGKQGMARVRGVLHERSRILYTEGVLAESYSDFDMARSRFKEILRVAPSDDIYFERATRKLKVYLSQGLGVRSESRTDSFPEGRTDLTSTTPVVDTP